MRPRAINCEQLFSAGALNDTLEGQIAAASAEVRRMDSSQFLKTTVDTLVEHFSGKYAVTPLQLLEDDIQMDVSEALVEVTDRLRNDIRPGQALTQPGQQVSFYIPYVGDGGLLKLRPNQWSSNMPAAQVGHDRITIALKGTHDCTPESFREALNETLSGIRQLIASQNSLIAEYEAKLPSAIRRTVEQRRAELEKVQGLAAVFNFPLVKKPGMPTFKPVELARRSIPSLPRASSSPTKAEPAISDEVYEDLLGYIRHTGASFESVPQTYMLHGEEGLRDIVLSHINAPYKGGGTAESFRKYGKTDIRLEVESRSAFVAECKVWGGEKVLVAALDQMLDYVTWRDTKAALIVFNKNVAGFSGIQETIPAALKSHKGFLREKQSPVNQAGEWRYVFKSTEDEAREVTVHVFAFNLYVAPDRAGKTR
jgi:hypothetical protein